jgi:ankyrin repeat protein
VAKRIIGLVCSIALLLGLTHALLRKDINVVSQEEQTEINAVSREDLYNAIRISNTTKIDKEYDNATDEQLDIAIETVKQLLEAGADPNMRISNTAIIRGYGVYLWYMDGGITPLMLSRVADVSRLLIEYGARVNDQDDYGRTALMISAFFDHYYNDNNTITKLLIENGADINILNNAGQTALYYALNWVNFEAIEMLISYGVDVNIRDYRGWSPFVAAKIYYYNGTYGYSETKEKIFQILMNAGSTISDSDIQLIASVTERNLWSEMNEGLNMLGADR